jgi:hypothetical protein
MEEFNDATESLKNNMEEFYFIFYFLFFKKEVEMEKTTCLG